MALGADSIAQSRTASNAASKGERLLVFIPMYNCQAQIPRVIAQLNDPRVGAVVSGVLCVDNRSTDNTLEAARAALETVGVANRTLLRNDDNYGLGGSHKVAIAFAQANGFDHVIVLHGDDQGSIVDLLPLIEAGAHREADCLLGARFMPGSSLEGYSLLRTTANHVFNLIFSAIARQRLYDLGSGLNLFRTSIFASGFHLKYADNLTFNYYLVLGLAHYRMRCRFFPLTWREDDQVSNAKLWKQGLQMLRLLWWRIVDAKSFFEGEHRATPRDSYPSTVIAAYDTAAAS